MIHPSSPLRRPSSGSQCLTARRSASETRGFTLVELLVVIAIIAVLAGLLFPAFTAARNNSNKAASMSNLRQLAAGAIIYAQDNNGSVPPQGEANPTWASATESTYATAWYNSVPRMAGSKGLADFAKDQADFYTPMNLLFVRAAKYPSNKSSEPLFAVAMNSKLYDSTLVANTNAVTMQNFQSPANTMLFQEDGLPGETVISGQAAYTNQSYGFASRTVARYNGYALMVMADGHVEQILGKDAVDPSSGKAYFPQIGKAGGKVYWTLNITQNANN
jgi:prepilin-type N-terminal cleavage/methylation domain-containing protein/prepilin-type processing-associated H-X9-DG protein